MRSVPPHAMTAAEALAAQESCPDGLTGSEAARRLGLHGRNRLPQAARRHPLLRFLSHFNNILIYVLLGAAVITAGLDHWLDTGVILAVVIANAVIGHVQEGRAESAMAAIRTMLAPRAAVLRDGRRSSIDAEELVPGDIVLLEAGDIVPADLRLIEARGARAEEAMLTGESVPVDKDTDAVAADAPLGDRHGMAFKGTLLAAGTARGVVVATGSTTEIGRISGLLADVETLTTPLVRQMDVFARWLTLFILGLSAALLAFGLMVRGLPFDEMFMIVVGLAVAAIPEGLPAVLTITLAVGVQAMARRNAIVRRLPAIETLGAVSVICSDKTGTLTRNEMVVTTLLGAGQRVTISGTGYDPDGAVRVDGRAADQLLLTEVARAAALCNDATLSRPGAAWQVEGDPMEGALLALAGRLSGDGAGSFKDHGRLDAIPFDPATRYMAVLARSPDGALTAEVKGAPEALLPLCADQRSADGGTTPLDAAFWHAMVETLAQDGLRVLALATRRLPAGQDRLRPDDLAGTLTLLGLVGLIDPPRAEAMEAVAECHRAGIAVKMITGDHGGTARAIAVKIGLKRTDRVLTGADLDQMSDEELSQAVRDCDVFARTSPADKLRLVTALQAHDLTVAMTGDGVNDAPALKRADAGVAMGLKGSDAAKGASELVLADDNFASIVAAVRAGRTVYDNIRKVISWTLPTNGGEAMTILVALLAGLALPVTAVQILWVNLVTATTLGIALAFEPTEPGTMQRPPRPRDAPLLSRELVWRILLVSGLFCLAVFGIFRHALDSGQSLEVARTMALNMLVVLEIFYLFCIRKEHGSSLTWDAICGTRAVWLAVVLVIVAQFAVTYLPALQRVFGTAPVPFDDGLLIMGAGLVFLLLMEVEKRLRHSFFR